MSKYKHEETDKYIESAKQFLLDNFGEIKENWKAILAMLGSQYDLFLMARDSVNQNGLLVQTVRGMAANPAIKIENDAIIQINKLIQELSLSPKQEIKLKIVDNGNDEEDFLEALTK